MEQSAKTTIKHTKKENQPRGISIFHDHLASAQATGNNGELDGEKRRVCHRIDLQMRLCHRVKAPWPPLPPPLKRLKKKTYSVTNGGPDPGLCVFWSRRPNLSRNYRPCVNKDLGILRFHQNQCILFKNVSNAEEQCQHMCTDLCKMDSNTD